MRVKKQQFRQGDVLIERVASATHGHHAPSEQPRLHGTIVLAHGEATGHAHRIEDETTEGWRDGEALFVSARAATEVRHEEHAPIPLRRGTFKVTRQREYQPEAIRNVAD